MVYFVVNTSLPEIAARVIIRITPAIMPKSPFSVFVFSDLIIHITAITEGIKAQTINLRLLS